MELMEKIQADMKDALKKREMLKVNVLRMVLSDLKYLKVEKGEEPDEGDILKAIKKAVKSRKDSVEQFKEGGRNDLVEKETKEIEILESYLPEQITGEELSRELDKIIEELGADSKKQFGLVMKTAMSRLKGMADGNEVRRLTQEKLN